MKDDVFSIRNRLGLARDFKQKKRRLRRGNDGPRPNIGIALESHVFALYHSC